MSELKLRPPKDCAGVGPVFVLSVNPSISIVKDRALTGLYCGCKLRAVPEKAKQFWMSSAVCPSESTLPIAAWFHRNPVERKAYETFSDEKAGRLHADRAPGSDRDHRGPDRVVASRG